MCTPLQEDEGEREDGMAQRDRSVLNVRIEMLVRMFARIVDLHNFHIVSTRQVTHMLTSSMTL